MKLLSLIFTLEVVPLLGSVSNISDCFFDSRKHLISGHLIFHLFWYPSLVNNKYDFMDILNLVFRNANMFTQRLLSFSPNKHNLAHISINQLVLSELESTVSLFNQTHVLSHGISCHIGKFF